MSQHKMLTKKTWRKYLKETNAMSMYGYFEATRDITTSLKEILVSASSLQEMKDNLSSFTKERNEFVSHIIEKWDPSKTP